MNNNACLSVRLSLSSLFFLRTYFTQKKRNTEKNDECLSVPASVWDKMTKIKTRIMYLYVHCRRRRMSYAVRDLIPLICMLDEEVWQPTTVHFVLGRTVRTSVVSVTKQRARIRAKNQRIINQSFHDVTRCVSFYVPSEWNTRREKKQKQKKLCELCQYIK